MNTGRRDGSAPSSLLRRVRESDAAAWQVFVKLYAPWVYSLARRAGLDENDAADVGQEVFLTAATRLHTFSRERADQSVSKWLAQIARHKIGDQLRNNAQVAIPIGSGHALPSQAGGQIDRRVDLQSSDSSVARGDRADSKASEETLVASRAIQWVRDSFRPGTWQCFEATVLMGRTSTDVADELGMSAKAVRQAKYRVLRQLREQFGDLIDGADGAENMS